MQVHTWWGHTSCREENRVAIGGWIPQTEPPDSQSAPMAPEWADRQDVCRSSFSWSSWSSRWIIHRSSHKARPGASQGGQPRGMRAKGKPASNKYQSANCRCVIQAHMLHSEANTKSSTIPRRQNQGISIASGAQSGAR